MSIIEVRDVTKRYRLGATHNLSNSLKRLFTGNASPVAKNHFNALDGVDFSVEEGEVLGIIGTNGAGKSTLLKVLSGITVPTTGSMVARGRVAPLIEVGAGLIADLTGRENVYLNGVILGMSVREVKRKFDEIVAFAELEEFIDTPIKRYSSGMAVRLGFAIATSVDADILIVDEVLAVGDVAFQRKCFDRMEDMIKRQHKTVLLVSHNIRQVERLCTRVLVLDHGKILMDDAPGPACELFYQRSDEKIRVAGIQKRTTSRWGNTTESDEVAVRSIELLDQDQQPTETIAYRKDFYIRVRFAVDGVLEEPVLGFGVHTPDLLYLSTHNSDDQIVVDRLESGEYEAICKVALCPLLPGVYAIRLGITEGSTMRTLFYGENLIHFQVVPNPDIAILNANRSGFFEMNARWQHRRTSAVTDGSAVESDDLTLATSEP